jgi:two-component system, response regulator YesN
MKASHQAFLANATCSACRHTIEGLGKLGPERGTMSDPLRVMIIDDEPMAIEYLRNLIPWEREGFAIVSEATDGETAIAEFSRQRPQVLIADICMPGLSGLDICEEILGLDDSVKILLLTAYREFDYAKRAIDMGIKHYIIKHELDAARLRAELSEVREEIRHEADTNKILAKYAVLNRIDEYDSEGMGPELQYKTLEKYGKTFLFAILRKDSPYPLFGAADPPLTGPDEKGPGPSLESLRSGLPGGYSWLDSFKVDDDTWALCFCHGELLSDSSCSSGFREIVAKAQAIFSESDGCSYSAVVITGHGRLDRLSNMRRRAAGVFERVPFLGRAAVIFASEQRQEEAAAESSPVLDGALSRLKSALDALDLEKADRALSEAFGTVSESGSPRLLRRCCDELAKTLDRWLSDRAASPILSDLAPACYTLQDIRLFFSALMREKAGEMDPRIADYSKRVRDALYFLYENYSRDISVSDVARSLDISESSLGKAFKAETGVSVLDYLTDIRMATSKKLLKNTNLRVYEIADKVGYKTGQYFSQVFLRATGMHPLEYRERSCALR